MPKTKTKALTVTAYDRDVADEIFGLLFYNSPYSTEKGLMEIPSASYQLVISALELIKWDASGEDRDAIRRTISFCEQMRGDSNSREWKRKRAAQEGAGD